MSPGVVCLMGVLSDVCDCVYVSAGIPHGLAVMVCALMKLMRLSCQHGHTSVTMCIQQPPRDSCSCLTDFLKS